MKRIYTISLFCAISCATSFAQMSSKLSLVFNEKDSVLTLILDGSEQSDLFINRKNNKFAIRLTDLLVEQNKAAVYVHDNAYCFLYYPDHGITFTDVDWFDSALCSELIVRFSAFGEPGKECPVSISINKELIKQSAKKDVGNIDKGKNVLQQYGWIGIVVILLLVLSVVVILVIKKQKRKSKAVDIKQNDADNSNEKEMLMLPSSVSRISVVDRKLVRGLDFIPVESENGDSSSYYLIDMEKNYEDTVIRNIWIHYSVVKKIYDFFTSTLETTGVNNETGCYLIGCWDNINGDTSRFDISIEDIVEPGDDIQPDEYSFSFGLKIGMNLHKKISNLTRKTGRDFVHTVWMHSHPGLGIFLSSSDLKVQSQLVNSKYPGRLAAFVIDTNTPDLSFGVFTAKKNGTMNNREDAKEFYSMETLYAWSKKENASDKANHDVMEVSVALSKTNILKSDTSVVTKVLTNGQEVDTQIPLPPEREGYYGPVMNSNTPVYFSAKSINSIVSLLYDSKGHVGLCGYLSGKIDDGSILVESCEKEEQANNVGCFSTHGFPNISGDQHQTRKQCLLVADDDNVTLIVTENLSSIHDGDDRGTHVKLSQMKEWTRRRRGF